jgi:uncharacterized protein YecE (DUF72 family)
VGQGRVWIGTSGWNYPHWRGPFYPRGLRQKDELSFLAGRLSSVEVNGTFYSLTRPEACAAWRSAVPADFPFAIKGSRYITHMLKLNRFRAPLANFFAQGILRLGAQLGPILWQLPPRLAFDPERAGPFFEALPRDLAAAERWARRHDARTTGRAALRAPDGHHLRLRHALEPRHVSWLEGDALALLAAHDIALVVADSAGRHPSSLARTASFSYLRLHGATALYASRYTDAQLETWAERIRALRAGGRDVHVYFDNDAHAHAPHDALRLAAALDLPVRGQGPPNSRRLSRPRARLAALATSAHSQARDRFQTRPK